LRKIDWKGFEAHFLLFSYSASRIAGSIEESGRAGGVVGEKVKGKDKNYSPLTFPLAKPLS
jgi:hypothetical protein